MGPSPRVLHPAAVRSSSSSGGGGGGGSGSSSAVDNSAVSTSLPVQSCSFAAAAARSRRRSLSIRAAARFESELWCSRPGSGAGDVLRRPVLRRAQETQQEQPGGLKTVTVEDAGVAVEGVIKVDKEKSARPSWGRVLVLAGGDLLALLVFASIGRANHGMPAISWEALGTADPFIAGWLLGAYFIGGFGPEGQGLYGLRGATFSAIKSWAVSIPIGLGIRALTTGHPPPQAFILITLGSTFVLLVSWRTLFTAIFPNEDTGRDASVKQGSVLEFFELLTSLVRRW